MAKNLPVVLALDNIRSLHNVGAIFRSSDAVNIERIILGGLTPTPPRTEIEKTALGAVSSVAWEYTMRLPETLQHYQQRNYHLCALEQTSQAVNLFEAEISFPIVLVVGHEKEGVSPECLTLCGQHFFLPMYGKSAHSLNVSTAVSVALYELSRQFCYY